MTTQLATSPVARISNRVDQLANNWNSRHEIVKKWYRLIRLEDDLAQQDMESVIGNDPRSSYNLATWLLTPKTWSVTSTKLGLSDEQIQGASAFEQLLEREVALSIKASRGRLHGSYLTQAIKLFVATGWIALASAPTQPRWTINAWNPMTVFPDYSTDGTLMEVGRKYALTQDQANTMIFREGWIPPDAPFKGGQTIRQWWVQMPGQVFMATAINTHLARPLGPTMFTEMPIYCQPAGGLPDDGTIINDKWKADVGQSIVGSVMALQKNFDRMMTYQQQILRDVANAKWIERTASGDVVKPADINKRGTIWSIDLGEDIWAVQGPGAPIDLRPHQFDVRQQIQRGTFQDTSFGADASSAFVMAQTTSATQQILQPFLDGIRDGNGELITRNAAMAQRLNLTVGGVPIPDGVPEDISYDFDYDIEIPGDFLQRANSARILNPGFRISQETLTEQLFPEIQDPFTERHRLSTEDVMNSQIMVTIKSIQELRQAAVHANLAGDGETEALFVAAANQLEAQIVPSALGPAGEPQTFEQMVQEGS